MRTWRDEQAADDRDRLARFIGYYDDKPRWRSNLEAALILAVIGVVALLFALGVF
jgi:hypothetical protein